MERYYVGAYWTSRKATARSCAHILVDFLGRCSQAIGGQTRWEDTDKPGSFPPLSVDVFTSILESGVARNDADGDVIRRLGFDFSLVARESKDRTWWLSGSVGSYSSNVGNSIVLLSPLAPDATATENDRLRLKSLLRLCAEAWNPDYGYVRSDELNDAYSPCTNGPTVSWMLYLSISLDTPIQYECESVGDSGKLITIHDGVFCSEKPQHRKLLRMASKRLGIPYKADFS